MTTRRAKVFISGPLKARTPWQRAANIATAQAMALDLMKLGASPLCPHLNWGHAYGHIEEEDALACCLTWLSSCDALVLLPGWEVSQGAQIERHHARRLLIPVREGLADIRDWLLTWQEPVSEAVQ